MAEFSLFLEGRCGRSRGRVAVAPASAEIAAFALRLADA
jgi:hypothetical protein